MFETSLTLNKRCMFFRFSVKEDKGFGNPVIWNVEISWFGKKYNFDYKSYKRFWSKNCLDYPTLLPLNPIPNTEIPMGISTKSHYMFDKYHKVIELKMPYISDVLHELFSDCIHGVNHILDRGYVPGFMDSEIPFALMMDRDSCECLMNILYQIQAEKHKLDNT